MTNNYNAGKEQSTIIFREIPAAFEIFVHNLIQPAGTLFCMSLLG